MITSVCPEHQIPYAGEERGGCARCLFELLAGEKYYNSSLENENARLADELEKFCRVPTPENEAARKLLKERCERLPLGNRRYTSPEKFIGAFRWRFVVETHAAFGLVTDFQFYSENIWKPSKCWPGYNSDEENHGLPQGIKSLYRKYEAEIKRALGKA